MGQYWKVFNLDKKEMLVPSKFDDGRKFGEFAYSGSGTMTALATLLAAPSAMGAGGGDDSRSEWTGRWIGDRVVIIGDYNEDPEYKGVYGGEEFFDISTGVRATLRL